MRLHRKPTTPGEILNEEFLKPIGITQKQFADHLKCDVKVINRIVNDRTSITAEMAIKLAAALKTSPEFWMNAQQAVDVYAANKSLGKHLPKPINKNEAA